jgi:hypothetical protein
MTRRFAMVGPTSGETLSYGGLILVHSDRSELEFLVPGVRVVELGSQIPEHDTMSIKSHPDLSRIEWPLHREDFR